MHIITQILAMMSHVHLPHSIGPALPTLQLNAMVGIVAPNISVNKDIFQLIVAKFIATELVHNCQ